MQRISAEELRLLLRSGKAPILDVRSAAEYESTHIPGAVRVGLDELRSSPSVVAAALPAGTVLVCRSGNRAEQAWHVLHNSGRDDLRVLDGGMLDWERGSGPLQQGRKRWDLERQVRLVAGSLVLVGVAGSLAYPPALLLAGGVGAGLAIAAATNTCAMGSLLSRLPYNTAASCATPRFSERVATFAQQTVNVE